MAKPTPKPARPQDIATKAQPFIQRIELLEAELKAYREGVAEDIALVVAEAEDAGIAKKALQRILRLRKLEQSKAKLTEKLDMDEAAQFAALAEAFGDSPFGEFARTAAEELRDAVRDLTEKADVSVHFAAGTQIPPHQDDLDHLAG